MFTVARQHGSYVAFTGFRDFLSNLGIAAIYAAPGFPGYVVMDEKCAIRREHDGHESELPISELPLEVRWLTDI